MVPWDQRAHRPPSDRSWCSGFVKNVVDYQFDEIQVFDYSIVFDKNMNEKPPKPLYRAIRRLYQGSDFLFIRATVI